MFPQLERLELKVGKEGNGCGRERFFSLPSAEVIFQVLCAHACESPRPDVDSSQDQDLIDSTVCWKPRGK